MLTKKQSELLRFIHERLQEQGVPPSFDEMKEALDLRSKSGIHRLILALEERNFIRRLPNRARASPRAALRRLILGRRPAWSGRSMRRSTPHGRRAFWPFTQPMRVVPHGNAPQRSASMCGTRDGMSRTARRLAAIRLPIADSSCQEHSMNV